MFKLVAIFEHATRVSWGKQVPVVSTPIAVSGFLAAEVPDRRGIHPSHGIEQIGTGLLITAPEHLAVSVYSRNWNQPNWKCYSPWSAWVLKGTPIKLFHFISSNNYFSSNAATGKL